MNDPLPLMSSVVLVCRPFGIICCSSRSLDITCKGAAAKGKFL